MALPVFLMYFGVKLVQRALHEQDETRNVQDPQEGFTRPSPTAPPIETVSHIDKTRCISGIIKDNYFYHNLNVLNLKNIKIINICVCPLSQTTDRPYSGKIYIMSDKGVVFKHEYNERVRHITLPGSGMDITNATFKVKIKTAQSVALQYTVVFSDENNSVLA